MQPDMEHLKSKVTENRDLLDRIILKLPGFEGYVEKGELQRADSIIRNLLADRLQKLKDGVNLLAGDHAASGAMDFLSGLESLSLLFEKLIRGCRYADYGNTAATSGVKLSEEDLNRLLEFDWRLITRLDETEKLIGELSPSAIEGIGAVKKELRNFEEVLGKRKDVVLEVL